jgi:cystathionine beta-synthase
LLAAALGYCREQTAPKRVVSFVCDTRTRDLSKEYNENPRVDQGLRRRPAHGDLRDLVARRCEEGAVVSVTPTDTLQTVFRRMR